MNYAVESCLHSVGNVAACFEDFWIFLFLPSLPQRLLFLGNLCLIYFYSSVSLKYP